MTAAVIHYADHNATTRLHPAARAAMLEAMDCLGNPSSGHSAGRRAKALLEGARRQLAERVDCDPESIVFTSGGSEANSLAILGTYFNKRGSLNAAYSAVEHSSVRDCMSFLSSRGGSLHEIGVSPDGALDFPGLEALLKSAPIDLVSVMAANNETGVLFDLQRVRELVGVSTLLHSDCVQALGKLAPAVWSPADLVAISAHKIGGPAGVGALILKPGLQLERLQFGGAQERKRRGGTENLVGIVGFGAAAAALVDSGLKPASQLEDRLANSGIAHAILGTGQPRLSNTLCIRFPGVPNEVLLAALDLEGVCVSAGSACSSGSISPSHVMLAMGLDRTAARECIRVSFGVESTVAEVDTVATAVISQVSRIQARRKQEPNTTVRPTVGFLEASTN